MRRPLSLGCLLFAWLCANGALWHAVQVVAWVKMFHAYSQVMPVAQALTITFDGSAPCELCHFTDKAQAAARDQLPREVALSGGEKILLATEATAILVLAAPAGAWPGVAPATGPARTDPVPVPPPRV